MNCLCNLVFATRAESTRVAVAAVIQNESCVRACLGQLDGIIQFRRPHAQVKTKSEFTKQANSLHEIGLQTSAGLCCGSMKAAFMLPLRNTEAPEDWCP